MMHHLKLFSLMQVYPVDSVHSDSSMKEDAQSSFNNSGRQGYGTMHLSLMLSVVVLFSNTCPTLWAFLHLSSMFSHWILLSAGYIHHLHLVHHLILKHLHFKPTDIILKMGIVLWVRHLTFLGNYLHIQQYLGRRLEMQITSYTHTVEMFC